MSKWQEFVENFDFAVYREVTESVKEVWDAAVEACAEQARRSCLVQFDDEAGAVAVAKRIIELKGD